VVCLAPRAPRAPGDSVRPRRLSGVGARPLNFTVMRPGQTDVNDFELAILSNLAEDRPSLRQLIPKLHVLSREFTGVGSYTKFLCSSSSADLGNERIGLKLPIRMPGVPNGMGAILFCEGGKPHTLETYTHGTERWDGVYTGFSFDRNA
jgi:hypothetical protein